MNSRGAAAIILYSSNKRILLQHRTSDAPSNPNKWGCFGGGIEEGESPIQAVKRECLEELGYELANPAQFLIRDVLPRTTIYYFAEKYDPSKPIILNEGQGFDWFTLDQAEELDSTETLIFLLQELKKGNPLS